MAFYLSPVLNEQQFDANGDPLAGGLIYTYLAGTTTLVTTYKTSTGTAQANPIVLDSSGNYTTGTQLWLDGGKTYKFVVKNSLGVTLRTIDNISPINDVIATPEEWVQYTSSAFTYLSSISFSIIGDQTNLFQPGRRVRTFNTGGAVYSTIATATYLAPSTTVTLNNDSGSLDSGLSSVYYGILAPTNPSYPNFVDDYFRFVDGADRSKKVAIEISGVSAATTRTLTVPDRSGTIALTNDIIVQRSYLAGFTMSTAGASATMTISAGQAADSANAVMMSLAASISKTTSAWAVGTGNGGLDTGTIANNTWYHFYVIRRPDTGVVDVVFSLSAAAPTLPTNYTQYRRIGSGKTNGSAQWIGFTQDGDYFRLAASVLDVSVNNPGTSAVLRTLASVPTGVNVIAIFNGGVRNTGSAVDPAYLFSDPACNDEAPTYTATPLTSGPPAINLAGGVVHSYAQQQIRTNTSAQIRTRLAASDASCNLNIATLGWIDSRGRNA